MRPFLIGIGGAHSSSGKTTVACSLLRKLHGWGAIKCTPTLLYSSVVDDGGILDSSEKDTGKFIEAGAAEVLWVQSTPEDMEETLSMAVDRLSHLPGIIVEGNSAIELLKPDIVIFIAGESGRMKEGASDILRSADVVIYSTELPEGTPGESRKFRRDETGDCVNYLAGVIDARKA